MMLDERILIIFEVIAVACVGFLELGFNTISLFEGHIRFVHSNLHVRKPPQDCTYETENLQNASSSRVFP